MAGFFYASKRGWIVDTPARQRILLGAMLVSAIAKLIGWPTGALSRGLHDILLVVILVNLFWPARKPSLEESATA